MNGGNLGPVPARLIFLTELGDAAVGDKVRFLGCVQHYDVPSGKLTLRHDISRSSLPTVLASVDARLLLETLKSTDTSIGEWLNIIGYVTDPPGPSNNQKRQSKTTTTKDVETSRTHAPVTIHVQALMLWSAGAVRLGDFEKTLKERKEVERRLAPQ